MQSHSSSQQGSGYGQQPAPKTQFDDEEQTMLTNLPWIKVELHRQEVMVDAELRKVSDNSGGHSNGKFVRHELHARIGLHTALLSESEPTVSSLDNGTLDALWVPQVRYSENCASSSTSPQIS